MTQWVRRFQPRELHKHLLRGSQLDRSTLRQEFEQPHQAWPWSGIARFGPTTPTSAGRLADASVDQTDARKQWGQEDHDGPDAATKKRGGRMTDRLRLLREELGDLRC
jgi:hypothetical protein